MKIPPVEQPYTAYHFFPIIIYNDRITSRVIVCPVKHLSECKQLTRRQELFSDLYDYLIDSNAMCEVKLLKNFRSVQKNCESSGIQRSKVVEYKVAHRHFRSVTNN